MICVHGEITHACVHEAGHALAALERGIPFVDVIVFGEPRLLRDDLRMGGRVKLDDDRSWRTFPALPLFEFALAGACSERAVLLHELPDGWTEDITIWRQTVKAFDARPEEAYIEILGEPIASVRKRMDTWARDRRATLQLVSSILATGQSLAEDDLRAVVAGTR